MADNTTETPYPRIQYSADGSQKAFAFPFGVLEADDLLVYIDQLPATGYAVSGLNDPEGGSVVFATPPVAGSTITLVRRTPATRSTRFEDGGPFRAAAINAELNRLLFLSQEDRAETARALRAQPFDATLDLRLPPSAERANRLLGFDSAGRPTGYGFAEVPLGTDISGHPATASGATTARALGEHLARWVDVRDFGAKGDGVTDDAAAFHAAIAAAQSRSVLLYVPASATPYVLGSSLTLDGLGIVGDGPGSTLKLAFASGAGVRLDGDRPRLAGLRLIGPGAAVWPTTAADVDLDGVSLDGVLVASTAVGATLARVDVAGCRVGLAVAGGLRTVVGGVYAYNRYGIEFRADAVGAAFIDGPEIRACSEGVRCLPAAALGHLAVRGGAVASCGAAVSLDAPASGWRTVELSDLYFDGNLDVDVEAGPRQSVAIRGGRLNGGGRRAGTALNLLADGATEDAPSLTIENSRAETTGVATVDLSGGSNLNLLAPGDALVLLGDADDIDDTWTLLKATRAGIVHRVVTQAASMAQVELAAAGQRPLLQAGDTVRVIGRSGQASVDTVGAIEPADGDLWLRAEDHCRVLSVHNAMPASGAEIDGTNGDFHLLPGVPGDVATVSGVEFIHGAVNGALSRLITLEIDQNAAAGITPPSAVGIALMFSHGSLGDPGACVFTYRADAMGYTQLLSTATESEVEVLQLTALTGTTGNPDKFTISAHSDGKIYVENRMPGTARRLSLHLIGAPL